jgi:hypothetical protein
MKGPEHNPLTPLENLIWISGIIICVFFAALFLVIGIWWWIVSPLALAMVLPIRLEWVKTQWREYVELVAQQSANAEP